jgi:hypothetical protein
MVDDYFVVAYVGFLLDGADSVDEDVKSSVIRKIIGTAEVNYGMSNHVLLCYLMFCYTTLLKFGRT